MTEIELALGTRATVIAFVDLFADLTPTIRLGFKQDGFDVAASKICAWFGPARRSAYYKPLKAESKVQERFAEPIRKMILEELSFGYRTVACLLRFNKNTVQRIFQLKGWQVKKRPFGFRSG